MRRILSSDGMMIPSRRCRSLGTQDMGGMVSGLSILLGPGHRNPRLVRPRVYSRPTGDPHMKEDLLSRSLSLIRRYPTPDCVDLTFASMEEEERLRKWAHDRLTVPE